MIKSIEDKVDRYINIYNSLYNKYKWHAQSQSLMLIPTIYLLNNRDFDIEEFDKVSEYIKKNSGFFSPLHSYQRFPTAAMLIAKFDDPIKRFNRLKEYQNKLIDNGFKNGPYTIISAITLMATDDGEVSLDFRIKKALNIYKDMRSLHLLLTSQSDYPLSVLLSKYDEDIDEIMDGIEYYYKKLSEGQFKRGNDLQFLSHILMLANIENKNFIIDRCNELYLKLIADGFKIRRIHYPQIGLMSIIDSELESEISYIKEVANRLNSEKRLKSLKDLNLIIAITLVVSDLLKNMNHDINIIEAGINTSIEAIIEAQSAALIATIAATSATTVTVAGN